MSQQDDPFPVPPLGVEVPKGLTEPRLWVRRPKIRKEPGGGIIRDIGLQPGLNIIWSPDGDDDPERGGRGIGHGSGKTLFCRLLRYCLGGSRFADEVQRDAISTKFPNGVVGAEVMLDGMCWAVARPLGIGRKHLAIEGGNLDVVAKMEGTSTGIEPLIDAIEARVPGEGTSQLARFPAGQRAWPVALAWAKGDQECRFDDVLDWRSSASGSDAPQPASGDARGPCLLAMRAFPNAIAEEEQAARRQEQDLASQIDQAKRQSPYLEHFRSNLRHVPLRRRDWRILALRTVRGLRQHRSMDPRRFPTPTVSCGPWVLGTPVLSGSGLVNMDEDLQRVREQLQGFEDRQAKAVGAISQKFSATIRHLLGDSTRGIVRLTCKGLEISVEAGGDRRTAAIQSSKVLSFDLACLCLGIEGRTRIPAFLIHDSPPEADLGQTIYDEHFRLLRLFGEEPAGGTFQYVITTTTKPPQDLNKALWRREVLRGAPGRERLLGCDLWESI